MHGNGDELKRQFLDHAQAAKQLDSKAGMELWSLQTGHWWFKDLIHYNVEPLVYGNLQDVEDFKQDVRLKLLLDML